MAEKEVKKKGLEGGDVVADSNRGEKPSLVVVWCFQNYDFFYCNFFWKQQRQKTEAKNDTKKSNNKLEKKQS